MTSNGIHVLKSARTFTYHWAMAYQEFGEFLLNISSLSSFRRALAVAETRANLTWATLLHAGRNSTMIALMQKIFRQLLNYRVLVCSIVFTTIGVIGLWYSAKDGEQLRSMSFEIFVALLTTGLIAFAWQLASARLFTQEILNTLHGAEELQSSRIVGSPTDFIRGIRWDELLNNATTSQAGTPRP